MMKKSNNLRGFTIVELLVVIAMIGVLAAITIVAYNGIQIRAHTATVTSDLANVARKMGADNAINGSYALTASAVDGGKGLPASEGTTYQFRSTADTYCITGTNHNISYMVSDVQTAPVAGGCSGDLVNGQIRNLIANPSLESNMTGWGSTWLATSVTRVTSGVGIMNGSAALEATITKDNASGAQYNFSNLKANTAYVVSGYVTHVSGDGTLLILRAADGAGTRSYTTISDSLVVGEPVRVSLPWTSSDKPNGSFQFMRNGTSEGSGVVRVDGVMITEGSTLYNYADGASPDWKWDGTSHSSTSAGPAV